MRAFFFSLIFLAMGAFGCSAEELKDQDQLLIKKCSEDAAAYFNAMDGKHEGTGKDGTTSVAKYKYHYNRQKSVCYILTSVNSFNDKKKINFYTEELTDIKEKQLTGSFMFDMRMKKLILCTVGSDSCSSKVEFDRLVKPYLTQ